LKENEKLNHCFSVDSYFTPKFHSSYCSLMLVNTQKTES
jgi:hypothetical protein